MTNAKINLDLMQKMLDISQRMAETRMLAPLLDYAVQEAIRLVGAEAGYLMLLNDDGTLDIRVKRDRDGDTPGEVEDQLSRSILDRTIATGRPVVVCNALDHPDFAYAASVQRLQLRSVMCVPLVSRGVTLGALYVDNRLTQGCFEEEDVLPLVFFANQAAVAIENAMLNDELEARVARRTAELKAALERLETSWDEAVEVNRQKTLLLGNILHDLRSPLSVARYALTMLADGTFGEVAPEQHEWLVTSHRSIDQALKLTEDIFLLTRTDIRAIELEPNQVNLRGFLEEMHRIGEALPWAEDVTFSLALDPLPETISLDPSRIHQVILNLLTNALKFTSSGTVTLYARQTAAGDGVVIGVRDTGEGIPENLHEKVFERFHQSGTQRRRGAGLGLAICKELVERHGGRIWVESQPGQGADFGFRLPLRVPAGA